MSHTPGPWKMEPGEPEMREGWSIGAPGSPHPMGADYTREDNVVGSCCSAGVYREEDARLICAAPEMLELMKKHLRESGCDGDLCSRSWHEEFLKVIRSVEPDWPIRL